MLAANQWKNLSPRQFEDALCDVAGPLFPSVGLAFLEKDRIEFSDPKPTVCRRNPAMETRVNGDED